MNERDIKELDKLPIAEFLSALIEMRQLERLLEQFKNNDCP